MKILVLQLARLGDIYTTWPALKALRRQHPQAQIHLLTRPRFEGAVQGLDVLDKHISLPVAQILEPMVQKNANVEGSLQRLTNSLNELKKENYDWIINFTFSPFSSYLTHALSGLNTKVTGYTRHNDGFLNFADEVSAYFYAQVGVGRQNRVHLADIFASMLGLEFIESDWKAPEFTLETQGRFQLPENYVVIHIGASESQKVLPVEKWAGFLTYFTERKPNVPVVLIGAEAESAQAQDICARVSSKNILNIVGRTKIHELFPILQGAMMLVGCDSAPIHMASLTDTATLNISLGRVNFWETGPKATHSFILRAESAATLVAGRVGEILALLLEGQVPSELVTRATGLTSYHVEEKEKDSFAWRLCQAIYLGTPFPVSEDIRFYEAVIRLEDVNNLVREQLIAYQTKGVKVHEILNGADEIIQSISQLVPQVGPIVSWYQAEKIRIPPGAKEDILTATMNVHRALGQILKVYIPQDQVKEKGVIHGEI
jgi:ADP-heptose:LPS heptosyltransferase